MTPPPHVSPQSLLAHTDWLDRLARQLVRDPHRAADLTQETWLAALRHPPRAGQSVRGWLATVLRNALAQEGRGAERRAEHEERAARPDDEPSALDLVERVATQRELSQHVLDLDEPYRTTLLLRFWEDLPPRAIARRMDVPVSTVKTRLARGLERLRGRLDAQHGGDGESWCLALIPVLELPHGISRPLLGGLLVSTTAKTLAAVLTIGAAATLYLMRDREAPVAQPGPALAAEPRAAEPAKALSGLALPAVETERAPVRAEPDVAAAAAPEAAAPAAPVVAPPTRTVRGLVLDPNAAPVSGVRVAYAGRSGSSPGEPEAPDTPDTNRDARTGPDGRFTLPAPDPAGTLVVDDERWTTVLASMVSATRPDSEPVIVAAPALALAGIVVDENGVPLDGVGLEVQLPSDLRARFDQVLDYSSELHFAATSADGGLFDLEVAPLVDGAVLRASLSGYGALERPLPVFSDQNLRLVLRRPRIEAGVLSGLVLTAEGEPAPGARVGLGLDVTTTDANGEFRFDLSSPDSWNRKAARYLGEPVVADEIVAVEAGYLPGRVAAERGADGRPLWPERVVVELGGPPLAIEGVVVDADGAPLEGMRVWVADTTLLGFGEQGPTQVETTLLGQPDERYHFELTDERGRFRLEGLLDQRYRVEAMDDSTLLRVRTEPIPAGSNGVVIDMPADGYFESLRGRVVSHSGEPVAGVEIFPMCDAFRARFRDQVVSTSHSAVQGTVTDEDGHFELENVPRSLVYLRLNGESIIPLEYGRSRSDGADGDDLAALVGSKWKEVVIEVDQRCHFQVELPADTAADEVAMLDADGNELVINVFAGNSRRESERVALEAGRSGTLGVSDAARTLVLYAGGQELRRVDVTLTPGEVTTLRP